MRLSIIIVIQIVLLCCQSFAADQFDGIKKTLADADCCSFEFVSVLSSSVFDTKDTSRGTAQIARDGRYRIVLGSDIYLCDGAAAYTYSPVSNQVIVERLDSGRTANKEVSFLTRLDDYYTTRCLQPNRRYSLTRRAGTDGGNIPDSMVVTIDDNRRRIARLDYLDVNDEQVSIVLTAQRFGIACDDSIFAPAFPDSAETVKF